MSLEKHINKSSSANSIFHKHSFSQGGDSFLRISPVKIPNTEGQCPIIIFKKEKKVPSFNDIGLRDSGYITDGGLKKKLQKSEGTTSMTKHHKIFSTSLKQKPTFSNSSGMKGKYSQSMRNINPKKSQDIKLQSKSSNKMKTNNMIEANATTSHKGQNSTSNKQLSSKQRQLLSPEMKYEQIEGLIGKGIASKIKDYQNECIKKTKEDELNEKKQRYLEDYGISIELGDLENQEEEGESQSKIKEDNVEELGFEKSKEIVNDNIDIADHQLEPKKVSKTNRTFSNSVFCGSSHKERIGESNSMRVMIKSSSDLKEKKILKPKIDPFEYLDRINNEMKIRSKELRTSESQTRSHGNQKHNDQNSFRKSHSSNQDLKSQSHHLKINSNDSNNTNQIIQIDSKKKQVYDEDENFLFSYQANHRSEEEIAHFIMSKRIQEQEKEQKENLENNQKVFSIFRNLYILSQRHQPKPNNPKPKKIKNEFYIGTQTNHNNLSTVIDPNDYYYSVLEGQKLIVKTHFDSEQNQLDKSFRNSNNVSKDNITKVTKHKAEESEKNSNGNMSAMQLSELKKKVVQTICRANKLLSQENLEQIFESKPSQQQSDNRISQENNKGKVNANKTHNANSNENAANTNKKDKTNNTHSTQQIISIENTSSYNGTKNLPSLSHTYTNSNTSPNKKNMIEPRAILNLVEIIKILTQRKVFYLLYEDYFNEKMIQRYTIAFVYFNAILKQRTFHSIEAYAHYKTYYYGCSQLFLPFKRKQFEFFVSICYFKKKVQYLAELLNHIMKKKVIERIYVYGRVCIDDEEIAFYNVFMKIMLITMRPKLQEAFRIFIENANSSLRHSAQRSNKHLINYEDSKMSSIDPNDDSNMDIYQKSQYTYDSCSEKSEITLEPNSLDSDKLHRVIVKNLNQKELMYNLGYSKEEIEEHDNLLYTKHHKRKKRKHSNKDNNISKHSLSNKSVKSLKEICQMKPGIKTNKSIDELQKSLSNKSIHDSLEEKLNYLKKSPSRNSSLNKSKDKDSMLNTSKNAKENEDDYEEESKDQNDKENERHRTNKLIDNLTPISLDRKRSKGEKEKIFIPEDKQSLSTKDRNMQIEVNIKEERLIDDKSLNENINKRKSNNTQITSEQDVSADKDCKENIVWEINLDNNKLTVNDKEKKDSDSIPISNTNDNKEGVEVKDISKDLNTNDKQIIVEDDKIKEANKIISEIKNENESELSKQDIEQLKKNIQLPSPIKSIVDNANQQKGNKPSSVQKSPKLTTDSYCNEFEEENLKELEENINNTEENIVNLIQNEVNQSPKDLLSQTNQFLSDYQIESLTNEIIAEIIQSEIKASDQRIIPYKTFKMPQIQINTSNSLTNPLHNSFDNPNNSMIFNSSYISHFSKTVKDKKKEQSLNLYKTKVFPKLIEFIKKEIVDNYQKIYKNLKTSIKSHPLGLMTSLSLEDAEMLRENYKRLPLKPNELELINKEKILNEYEVINKKIRSNDNIICDTYYDNMLNGCVVETAIELLQKERQYGDMGEPLPWSSRTRELNYKYSKDDPLKLANHIVEQLTTIINNKIGLITDNYDHIDSDQLNMERERRLLKNITNELYESDNQWINLEMEETQTKIEVNKLLLDQLFNEVIEILEHIQYSRKCPELYQNKSIYACEEIPKLTFQMTSSENEDDEENELINI